MTNCDDIFNEIQALQARREGLKNSHTTLSSIDNGDRPDPARTFLFKDKNGQEFEANFDDLWRQISQDPLAQQEWARKAVDERYKPVGSEGQFENVGQLVDQIGLDNAEKLTALLTKMTGDWERLNPADFNLVTQVNDEPTQMARMANAFKEARVNIDTDTISRAIAKNVAPFLGILNNQAKLEVFAHVTRINLMNKVAAMADQIAATGIAPTREVKVEFLDSYAKAIFAHRSKRIGSRRSGQLLNNYKRLIDEDATMPESLWQSTGAESKAEAEAMANEVIAMTPEEMVQENSLARRVVEAVDKGEAGLKDLEAIQLTLKTEEGVDPIGDNNDGWESTWRRNARAGYKDSILSSLRSELLSNYASQKIVFVAEGFKRVVGRNAGELGARRLRGNQLSLLGDDPEALAAARNQPIYVNPLATGFFRDALKDQLDGARIAVEAGRRAEAVIKQTWAESFRKGFFESDTPFGGNTDHFVGRLGQLDIEGQYQAAQEVMNEPLDPRRFLFQLRDKLHTGLKLLANSKIEAMGGPRLPVYSALQANTAVDQRAGLRVFMTDRANELMIEQAAMYPDRTIKEWGDAIDAQLADQLYQAEPSPQNIKDAREQFNLAPDELTDDEVAAYLAAERVGYPVLSTPGQYGSITESIRQRMQERHTKGAAGFVDNAMSEFRRTELGDATVPFWRAPFNQVIWDVSLANPFSPVMKVAQVAYNLPQGKVTPKMLAEAQASTLTWLSLATAALALRSQGLITGNGPLDPQARKQWMQRLNAEHKVPNSVFGIPFNMGGIPVLNSLFLMVDAMDVIDQGNVSKNDQLNVFQGLVQVGSGTVMRMPAFRQVQMTYDAFANGNENAFRKLSGWFLNGQANPFSAGERMAEWASGTQANDLVAPRAFGSGQDRYDFSRLPEDHPLKSTWNGVRRWVYESNPGVSHWMGLRLKEKTWLGRDLVRPDGIFRGEWPIGVPGIWQTNQGDSLVEQKLEDLGMLNPPKALMSGKLGSGFMTPDLEEEYNHALGQVKPARPFSRDSQHGGTVIWRGPEAVEKLPGGRTRTARPTVDLTRLMDEATNGRTVREAINYLLQSKQYQKWDADPRFTTNHRINDLPRQMRQRQPGPTLIQRIKDYYADLAESEMEKSATPAAAQWRADKDKLELDAREVPSAQRFLQQTAR